MTRQGCFLCFHVRDDNQVSVTGNERINPVSVVAEAIKSGPVTLSINGDSMLPYLESGRSVQVEQSDLRFGDIAVVINDAGGIVVHRHVITIGRRSLLLGDNNPWFDSPVDAEHVLGRVTAVDGEPSPCRHRVFLTRRVLRLVPRMTRNRLGKRRG